RDGAHRPSAPTLSEFYRGAITRPLRRFMPSERESLVFPSPVLYVVATSYRKDRDDDVTEVRGGGIALLGRSSARTFRSPPGGCGTRGPVAPLRRSGGDLLARPAPPPSLSRRCRRWRH